MTKQDIKTLLAASQILHEMNTHGGPYLNRLSAEVRDVVKYASRVASNGADEGSRRNSVTTEREEPVICTNPNCELHGMRHTHTVLPTVVRTNPQYLGDGVYASWDAANEQVWLSVNDHEAEPVVALNFDVLSRLYNYVQKMNQPTEPNRFDQDGGK